MSAGSDFQRVLIQPALEELLGIEAGHEIVDVCCGNGELARRMADLGAHVIAIDFAEEMIVRARARSGAYERRIEYRVMDATKSAQLTKLGNERFDAAVCNMALMDMSAIEPLIDAACGWLKPQGSFIFSVPHPCFNSSRSTLMAERVPDSRGETKTVGSVKLSGYKSEVVAHGVAIRGQPGVQPYVDRPLEVLFGAFFERGFVLDAFKEPSFPGDAEAPQVNWRNLPEFPPVLVSRMRPQTPTP